MVSIDRLERLALAGEDDPADQLARALLGEGVEHRVDDVAQSVASPRRMRPIEPSDRAADDDGDVLGQRAVKPGDRAEMVEQVGVGAADPLGHRLQRHRRGAFADQQVARGLDRGGAAFVGRQSFADS